MRSIDIYKELASWFGGSQNRNSQVQHHRCGLTGNIGTKRAFIPKNYKTPREKVIYLEPSTYNPFPRTIRTITTEIPKGFKDSHSITNYDWIFEQTPNQEGYVTPR